MKQKLQYKKPNIKVVGVYLEHGIAASSATVVPGNGQSGNYSPEVEDWKDETQVHQQDF
ncbi:hypothetical protein ACP6L2_04320 [Sphingobacterium lactis]|uniref:hypothetical protein n=1 Tax=Sphingobacterium lactis TaxID=797291 RepID=UPI003F81ABE9